MVADREGACDQPRLLRRDRVANAQDSRRQRSQMRHGAALDWMNFCLADVRGGVAPYIGIFLLTHAAWDPAAIGLVLTLAGLFGIAFHVPIGALIDATRYKRGLLVGGVVL